MPPCVHGVSRAYDDVDDLDGKELAGVSYSGATLRMLAPPGPFQGAVARMLVSNIPGQVRILVTQAAKPSAPPPLTIGEWAVAVFAGLFAAALIGVVAVVS